jgi:hypothetical protein
MKRVRWIGLRPVQSPEARALLALLFIPLSTNAQIFSQRGYLELTGLLYPQNALNDSSHAVAETLLRYEALSTPVPAFHFSLAIDLRADSHRETGRDFAISYWDRERLRPAVSIRRMNGSYTRGKLNVVIGRQSIRWGKTDILIPTDRFAPRDFLNVVDDEFLSVTAARLTYGGQSDTIDVIAAPRFTPSRVPLLNQRWAVIPPGIPIAELKPDFPGGAQFGARWNHIGSAAEYSFSFYNGFDHLPLYRGQIELAPLRVSVQRYYPQMRMVGADAAVPLPIVTLKAEAAYFMSAAPQSDEYALYVIQLERQTGEWSFVGGYAGQIITAHGPALSFSPVRGLTRAFVAHAGYTIDTNRSLAFDTVIRQNGRGVYLKPEYTHAIGQHWRLTAGFALIRGNNNDFLGQYHRNSHTILALRYSF